jgi:kinesin family protein 6/9
MPHPQISVESRQEGSSTIRRSKLHLVDLAGSERTHKTNSSGQLFREATHINKSLHFLEMVIVALQEQKKGLRTHIPYRNSMLTSVIRDSLGGNCKTSMIATINPEFEHTDESISTCRFAQRVARVQNSAIINEEADPSTLIRNLKSKLSTLESEVKYLKGESVSGTCSLKPGCMAAIRSQQLHRIAGRRRRSNR